MLLAFGGMATLVVNSRIFAPANSGGRDAAGCLRQVIGFGQYALDP
jgi:hypothetical protein